MNPDKKPRYAYMQQDKPIHEEIDSQQAPPLDNTRDLFIPYPYNYPYNPLDYRYLSGANYPYNYPYSYPYNYPYNYPYPYYRDISLNNLHIYVKPK